MADTIVEKALELLNKDVNFYFSKINSDTFLTQNQLHKAYKQFEVITPPNSSEICKKDDNHSSIDNDDDDIVKLCRRVENILKNWDSIFSTENGLTDNNCCDYLIYWIYGKLIEGNYTLYSVHWLYRKIQELLEKKQPGTSMNLKCNRNFKRVFEIENLKNMKYLHDFLEYFNSIKSILKSGKHVKQDYCDYIYYILQLYKNMIETCYSRIPEACPEEIKLFQDKINGDDLSVVEQKCTRVSQKFKLSNLNAILDQLNKEQEMLVERVKWPFIYRKLINYDIFHNLNIYKNEEPSDQEEQKNVSNETEQCTKINSDNHEKNTNLDTICKDFILYFLKLSKSMINSIHYFDYLNYWLNKKLKGTGISATKFVGIIDKLSSYKFPSNLLYKHFKYSVYDMDDKILKEMDILHNLYDYYYKFLDSSKNECPNSDNKCLSTDVTEINKCDHIKNRRFYKALTNIFSIYNNKYQEKCKSQTSSELPPICNIFEKHITNINKKNCTSSCQTIKNTGFTILPKVHYYVYYYSILLNIFTNSLC
ncbi:hypothetical protein PVMG_05397 [Plasmodium vivax Mauritania I]|uniref:PIR Superfamily Protein n=1 Tax=Plasmodium vivax Mauritania I TaxID=1035515 RepID=A0A0J9TFV6_PLAVI|nr:hypothetical protein PVMG_05397 [Plasmodium vivax Mauritania I]